VTSEWKPIEEAPKDGTEILVWINDGDYSQFGLWSANLARDDIRVDYFIPLRKPPTSK